jgi:RNA polymerase sigma factor (sigma-70 family)
MNSSDIRLPVGQPVVVADLVRRAGAGDGSAWNALVDRFAGLVWSITQRHRLGAADAADVSQTTWLRLVENLDRIESPEYVGAWLATTARHESLRVLRLADRQRPVASEDIAQLAPSDERALDTALLAEDRSRDLAEVMESLPPRCRELLAALMQDGAPNYVEIGKLVGMPTGSIGPTRARCLERIRRLAASRGIYLDRDVS